ncbi:type ISP restriction/modification enzyme [Flavobacterium segetis]
MYVLLYVPTYRQTNKEFLKIEFPRVTYLRSLSQFRTLTKLIRVCDDCIH